MLTPPTAGKIYRSETSPRHALFIEEVSIIDADEECDAGFIVEARTVTKSGALSHDVIELNSDDWRAMMAEHRFAED